jgi:hypothetical protein
MNKDVEKVVQIISWNGVPNFSVISFSIFFTPFRRRYARILNKHSFSMGIPE